MNLIALVTKFHLAWWSSRGRTMNSIDWLQRLSFYHPASSAGRPTISCSRSISLSLWTVAHTNPLWLWHVIKCEVIHNVLYACMLGRCWLSKVWEPVLIADGLLAEGEKLKLSQTNSLLFFHWCPHRSEGDGTKVLQRILVLWML